MNKNVLNSSVPNIDNKKGDAYKKQDDKTEISEEIRSNIDPQLIFLLYLITFENILKIVMYFIEKTLNTNKHGKNKIGVSRF